MTTADLPGLLETWRFGPHTGPSIGHRVVLFGSSNTELGPQNRGYHCRSDVVSIALRIHVGRQVLVTNAGASGQTVIDLLARVNGDIVPLVPLVALITIGGNDQWHMPVETYCDRLAELVARLASLGVFPTPQSY